MENVFGAVASIDFHRLTSCLSSIGEELTFPICCFCQGMSDAEIAHLRRAYPSKYIHFTFVERPKQCDLFGIANKLLELTKESRTVYLFDDDFSFRPGALKKIAESAANIQYLNNVGAVSFNRINDDRLDVGLPPVHFSLGDGFFYFDDAKSISDLWTNGGILLKREAFGGFALDGEYIIGEDIGIFVDIYLNGYDILRTEIDALHWAGQKPNSFSDHLEKRFLCPELEDHYIKKADSNSDYYNKHPAEQRTFLLFKYLEDKNYLVKHVRSGTVMFNGDDRGRAYLTANGRELHARRIGMRLGRCNGCTRISGSEKGMVQESTGHNFEGDRHKCPYSIS